MIFNHTEKNIQEKLKDAEIADLKAYCKSQGFTEEQTTTFIKNSIMRMLDGERCD